MGRFAWCALTRIDQAEMGRAVRDFAADAEPDLKRQLDAALEQRGRG